MSTNHSTEILKKLKVLPNWVAWKLEKINGKETKPPYIVGTNRHASATDSSTWATHEAVVRSIAVNGKQGKGFAFGNSKIASLDMDGCRNPKTGETAPWADEILDSLPRAPTLKLALQSPGCGCCLRANYQWATEFSISIHP